MRLKLVSFLGVLALGPTGVFAADCSRDDIDHYLDRGFTPAQVLELCRAATPALREPNDVLSYWRDAIDAKVVVLDDEALSFTREQCLEYDRPNAAEQRKKACGEVTYRIGLAGLVVEESSKKLLYWGRNAVVVSSPDIQRQYQLNQAELRERDRELLQREFESGARTEVPVRDGVAVDVVRQRLTELARP